MTAPEAKRAHIGPKISEDEWRVFVDDPDADPALRHRLLRTPSYPHRNPGGFHWWPSGEPWQVEADGVVDPSLDHFACWWPASEPIVDIHPQWGAQRGGCHGGLYDPDAARLRWRLAEEDVLHVWMRNHPGTRPTFWWTWSAPDLRRKGEGELDYLQRHGLLDKVERRLLGLA
jgi:hypothetical protein